MRSASAAAATPGGTPDDRVTTDHGMTIERRARAVGDFTIEAEQIEAVTGGEEAQEFVLRHDLAVRAEPRRAGEG